MKSEGGKAEERDGLTVILCQTWLDSGVVYLGKTQGVTGLEEQELGATSPFWAVPCV